MMFNNFAKKIRNYAIASFLIPLIAINACFLIYKFLGDLDIKLYPNVKWNEQKQIIQWNEYDFLMNDTKSFKFTVCPKYQRIVLYNFTDNQNKKSASEYSNLVQGLITNNKVDSVTIVQNKKILDNSCVKNSPSLYSLLLKLGWLETILIKAFKDNPVGFAKIKNPYLYGEVSISRTARHFPAIFIFKSFLILSSFLLFLYWKNTLNLFNALKNKNILNNFSKKFFYFGIFSCIFLALHAAFLGLDIDSKLFAKIRKLIIILFIVFEILAQIYLTKNLFKFKEKLEKYIHPLILRIKIIFVVTVFLVTFVAFTILAFGNPSSSFKHTLEWNYFAFLLLYYLFSRFLWRRTT